MGHQDSDLKRRLEYLETHALQFAEEMAGCEDNAPRASSVWRGITRRIEQGPTNCRSASRADGGSCAGDGAVVVDHEGDIRDLARAGRRIGVGLQFEEYTGSMLRRGEPIRTVEAQFILKNGFEAIAEWIALVAPKTVVAASLPGPIIHPNSALLATTLTPATPSF